MSPIVKKEYFAWVVPRGEWIAEWPSTNAKIVFGMRLTFAYIVLLLLVAIGDSLTFVPLAITDEAIQVFEIIAWLLAALLALGVGQYVSKRATEKPTLAPAPPTPTPAPGTTVLVPVPEKAPAISPTDRAIVEEVSGHQPSKYDDESS